MATSVPSGFKSRNFVFTINNYSEDTINVLKGLECRYLVFGREIAPTTGTKHLQGLVCFATPRASTALKKKLPTIHLEPMRGTHQQASTYCKKDGDFEEFGEIPKQGQRTDWETATASVASGMEVVDIIQTYPYMLPAIRSIERFKTLSLKPLHREVNVICIVGDAGAGKSRYAYDNYPTLYSKPRGEWWDGYTGQKQVLLDDYYGYLPYCELLRVLDRYPLQLPVKGGYIYAQYDTIIITSNKHPKHWYSNGLTQALRRRLKKIIFYRIINGERQVYEEDLQEGQEQGTQDPQTCAS